MMSSAEPIQQTQEAEAEISVNAGGNDGMTPERFVELLRANGYTGNTSTNPNHPGKAWIGFRNS